VKETAYAWITIGRCTALEILGMKHSVDISEALQNCWLAEFLVAYQ
jgi:hypothetical protein